MPSFNGMTRLHIDPSSKGEVIPARPADSLPLFEPIMSSGTAWPLGRRVICTTNLEASKKTCTRRSIGGGEGLPILFNYDTFPWFFLVFLYESFPLFFLSPLELRRYEKAHPSEPVECLACESEYIPFFDLSLCLFLTSSGVRGWRGEVVGGISA